MNKVYEPIEPYFLDVVLEIHFEDNANLTFEIKDFKSLPRFLSFFINHVMDYRYSSKLDFMQEWVLNSE